MNFSKKQMFYAFVCVVVFQSMVTQPMFRRVATPMAEMVSRRGVAGAWGKTPKDGKEFAALVVVAGANVASLYVVGNMMDDQQGSDNNSSAAKMREAAVRGR